MATKKEKKEKKELDPVQESNKKKMSEPGSVKIRATFIAPVLGTAPGNPEIYEEFIGGKSSDKERVKEEIGTLSQDELVEKGKTVFHRGSDGNPILYDYQIKGMIKEAFKAFIEFAPITLPYGQKINRYTVTRIIDNFVFVYPREIPLVMPDGEKITDNVRPLRAQTMRGERVSLACSEQAPKGTVIEFTVEWLNGMLKYTVMEALKKGEKKGIGQWRNSGMGRFTFEVIE